MEQWIHPLIQGLPWYALVYLLAVNLYMLGKGADLLVEEAVALSVRWGVPKLLIGATIVSLGTTTPEAAVSVLAAVNGKPDIALGNAVGSIICDTGLILGIAALIAPLPLNRKIVNRQGWLQLGSGVLLVVSCLFVGTEGRHLPRLMGVVFLVLLVIYLWQSIRWSRSADEDSLTSEMEAPEHTVNAFFVIAKLLFAILIVIVSASILIPTAEEAAKQMGVPKDVIAATIIAFGTSLPELVTAVAAARRGHGELAVGNVIGADILNVLFVAGASAAVTGGGLLASDHFFHIKFPAMLFILVVFRIGIFTSGSTLKRPFGFVLIGIYLVYTIVSFMFKPLEF